MEYLPPETTIDTAIFVVVGIIVNYGHGDLPQQRCGVVEAAVGRREEVALSIEFICAQRGMSMIILGLFPGCES